MSTLTLAIPEEMKAQMDECREINWSEVARAAIKERLAQLRLFKSIVSKSKLTEQDALELGRKLRKSIHERHIKELAERN